jgi:hypothetical protein
MGVKYTAYKGLRTSYLASKIEGAANYSTFQFLKLAMLS